jgi:glycerate 2-kinase
MEVDFFKEGLADIPQDLVVRKILNAAINSVLPEKVISKHFRRVGNELMVFSREGVVRPIRSINLNSVRRIKLVGIGKAAGKMAVAASRQLAGLDYVGLLVLKHKFSGLPSEIEQVIGGHPVPNEGSLEAGKKMKAFLSDCHKDDLVIFLISGGGSALITLPEENITLGDIRELTSALLGCGATIQEMNTVRKQIDQVKGGGLAKWCGPSQVISLILSDVIGNPLDIIASGPTVFDGGTRANAMSCLERYNLLSTIPVNIINFLIKPEPMGQPPTTFPDVLNTIIGDNDVALYAAAEQANLEGFATILIPEKFTADVNIVAEDFWRKVEHEIRRLPSGESYCILQGGEPTVKINGAGKGGRNQHLALLLASKISSNQILITLATDGEDGPTDAAGAVISMFTKQRADKLLLNEDGFLQKNDSYHYLEETHSLLKTGPTGTNVNDLLVLFGSS